MHRTTRTCRIADEPARGFGASRNHAAVRGGDDIDRCAYVRSTDLYAND